ncbi:acyltransferase [Bordetella genomosp. 10]|uniref:Acyltransferase n=1 Tax=Bordetella genomosp. 10 TaxID=1416804 RepID=A0A261SMX8_9BORD|nr:OpgC domain-containing protein [Bordetella genomosp. 10]OZI37663.1 acyltransferase [Bordetella genomosp. 10]
MAANPSPSLPPHSGARAPGAAKAARPRMWELDAVRGLMLVLMLSTHLPTKFAIPASQPFGFVSAAEGFVMLSAYMAGLVYTRRYMRDGLAAMHKAFLRRALVVYSCQAACLLFLFTLIAVLGLTIPQPDVQHLMWYYLQQPTTAFLSALALIYNPPLLDILPIYVMFMLLSPWVLSIGLRHGWRTILTISGLLWFATQFGLSKYLYGWLVDLTGLPVPFSETGAFETFGWQLLWIFGLWLGATHARVPAGERRPFSRMEVAGAALVAGTFFIWRHLTGQAPFADGEPINFLWDKWHLGPMRLLNFFALVVLAMHYDDWIKRRLPRVPFLETMGQSSLSVFCAHLVVVLLALCVVGVATPARSSWLDAALYIGSVILLYGVAVIMRSGKAAATARQQARPAPALAGAGAGKGCVNRGGR